MESSESIQAVQTHPIAVTRPVYTAYHIINSDISNHIIVKQLAKQSGTNECLLKKGFRELFNISIYQYLLQCRMKKAYELLHNSSLKQKDIAAECGYETLAGFVTAFRKHFGKPPGELRKFYLNNAPN